MTASSTSSVPDDRVALGLAAALVVAPDTRAAVLDALDDALRDATSRELESLESGTTSAAERMRRLRARLQTDVLADARPSPRPSPLSGRGGLVPSLSANALRARAALGPIEGAPTPRLGFRPWRAATTLVANVLRAPSRPDPELDRAAGRILLAETCATLDDATCDALVARLSDEDARIVAALRIAYVKVAKGAAPGDVPAPIPERARLLAAVTRHGATIDPVELGALLRGAATLLPTDDASAHGSDLARLDPAIGRWARAQRGRIT